MTTVSCRIYPTLALKGLNNIILCWTILLEILFPEVSYLFQNYHQFLVESPFHERGNVKILCFEYFNIRYFRGKKISRGRIPLHERSNVKISDIKVVLFTNYLINNAITSFWSYYYCCFYQKTEVQGDPKVNYFLCHCLG